MYNPVEFLIDHKSSEFATGTVTKKTTKWEAVDKEVQCLGAAVTLNEPHFQANNVIVLLDNNKLRGKVHFNSGYKKIVSNKSLQ